MKDVRRVELKLSKEEKIRWRTLAAQADMTLSAWIRSVLNSTVPAKSQRRTA